MQNQKIKKILSAIQIPVKAIYGWLIFHFFWLRPIEKKVVFSSFSGKRYGDSPRYISEELYKSSPKTKQTWVYYEEELKGVPKYVKQVKWGSLEMLKELATARVWVDSHYKPTWVFKRKRGQFFIETWHGGLGFKKIGFEVPEKIARGEKAKIKHTAKIVDLWLSNSDLISEIFRKGNLYNGEILKSGLPKTAFLINNEKKSRTKLRDFYHLSANAKIAVYAPTMRDLPTEDDFRMDFDAVLNSLNKRFEGDWKCIVRLHPVNELNGCYKRMHFNEHILNGSTYNDMQELIAGADVYISDYSSAMFDSGILRHPTFCFAYDEKKYINERGLYVGLENTPFPVARSNEELCKKIIDFDQSAYLERLEKYFNEVGLFEPNDSTEKIVEIIVGKLSNETK